MARNYCDRFMITFRIKILNTIKRNPAKLSCINQFRNTPKIQFPSIIFNKNLKILYRKKKLLVKCVIDKERKSPKCFQSIRIVVLLLELHYKLFS